MYLNANATCEQDYTSVAFLRFDPDKTKIYLVRVLNYMFFPPNDRREGLKYRKALEWRIPVLNVQWLTDLMLGNLEALKLPPQSKYQQFGSEDDLKVELWRVGLLLGMLLMR